MMKIDVKFQVLRDQKGNVSSKRVMAFLALFYAMQYPYTGTTGTVIEVVKLFLGFTAIAVGAVATEFLAKKGEEEGPQCG